MTIESSRPGRTSREVDVGTRIAFGSVLLAALGLTLYARDVGKLERSIPPRHSTR